MKHSRLHIRQQCAKHRERKRRRFVWMLSGAAWGPWADRLVRAKDRVPCSCGHCGNPRRNFLAGDPIQARRADLRVEEAAGA